MSNKETEKFTISEEAIAKINKVLQEFGQTMEQTAAAFSEWFDTSFRPIIEKMANVDWQQVPTPDTPEKRYALASLKISQFKRELDKMPNGFGHWKDRRHKERAVYLWSIAHNGTEEWRTIGKSCLKDEYGIEW